MIVYAVNRILTSSPLIHSHHLFFCLLLYPSKARRSRPPLWGATQQKFKRPIIPRWLLGEPTESPKASEVVSRGCKQGLWRRAGQARRCREPSTALPTNSLCIRRWLEYSLCHLITTWQQPLLIPGGQRVNVYSISPGWKAGGKWFKHTSQPVKLRPATEWD